MWHPRFFFALAWGFVLLASFAGWGLMLTRGLRLRNDWGQAIARGIALTVVIGGLLNLIGAISAALLLAWVGVGVVLCVAWSFPRSGRFWRFAAWRLGWLDLVAIGAVLVSYTCWLCLNAPSHEPPWRAYTLNPSDDVYGYALYPLQMLQTGAMQDDPFNDRRSTSGLGGESLLQAIALLFLPLPYIHVVDPGVAHLAMASALYSMGRRWRWPRALPGALVLLYAVTPTDAWNASAISLPVVLLLSIYRAMAEERASRANLLARALAVALPCAAVLSLKNTMVPGALAILGFGTLARMIADRRIKQPLMEGLLAGLLTFLMLLPWMVASYRSCGTLLFPLLGEGYRKFSTVAFPHKESNRSARQLLLQVYWVLKGPRMIGCGLATLTAVFLLARGGQPRQRRAATAATLAASALTVALYLVMFPMTASYRYGYPFVVLLLVLSFGVILGRGSRRSAATGAMPRLAVSLAWLFLMGLTLRLAIDYRTIAPTALKSVQNGLTNQPFAPTGDEELHHRLQHQIPAGARVFCMVDMGRYALRPILFDFARNVLWVHDVPGGVSPPPGIPLEGDGQQLAAYLQAQGIGYVILHRESDTPERLLEIAEELRNSDNWLHSYHVNYARLTKLLRGVAADYPILYEEQEFLVIDLTKNK